MSRRGRQVARRVVILVSVLAVAAVATGAAIGFGSKSKGPAGSQAQQAPKATTTIIKRTLTETKTVPGKLAYGTTQPLTSKMDGTVTWLPPVGSVVRRGGQLLRADERPIVLLYGPLPAYRDLREELGGLDVKQFEENLWALGYRGFKVDKEFSKYTTVAVKRWQDDLGIPQTGVVETKRIVYAPGPVRIAEQSVRVGASSAGDVVGYTALTKSVNVDADASDMAWATKGIRVEVVLPGGERVEGVVAHIAADAERAEDGEAGASAEQNGPTTIPVRIDVKDQAKLAKFEKAPVDVTYFAQQRKDVLTAPVSALLALAEGGYGLEIVPGKGKPTQLVAVEVGMFADGVVEVRGDGIAAGAKVAMPK